MDAANFTKRFVKNVGGRLSLVEQNGKCALLNGKNDCTVYNSRPKQCQQFPFWPSVLAGGEDYKNARDLCPGILEVPTKAARGRAYVELREFYLRVDVKIRAKNPICELSGKCCDFPAYGHKLFATILETDFAAEYGPPASESAGAGEREDWCAFYHGSRCHAREARPLACRIYFCDPATTGALADLHEELLLELRELERRHVYPSGYGDFVELLPARRNAITLFNESRRES